MTDFIKPGNLDAENSFVVGTVTLHTGETTLIPTKSADVTNSGSTLNTTASEENRSAKFKSNGQDSVSGPAGAMSSGHTR